MLLPCLVRTSPLVGSMWLLRCCQRMALTSTYKPKMGRLPSRLLRTVPVEVSAVCTTGAEYVGVSFEEECPAQREVSLYIYIYIHISPLCVPFSYIQYTLLHWLLRQTRSISPQSAPFGVPATRLDQLLFLCGLSAHFKELQVRTPCFLLHH